MHRSSCSCHGHGGLLTAKGLAETAQRESDRRGVDNMDMFEYLDTVGSVSDSSHPEVHWDDALIEEQDRRFHNGS